MRIIKNLMAILNELLGGRKRQIDSIDIGSLNKFKNFPSITWTMLKIEKTGAQGLCDKSFKENARCDTGRYGTLIVPFGLKAFCSKLSIFLGDSYREVSRKTAGRNYGTQVLRLLLATQSIMAQGHRN